MNIAIISGNLTADPEMKYLSSGTAICNFSVAVNSQYKKGEEIVKEVDFFTIKTFGKLAEISGEYLKKGRKVTVNGKLKQERWEKDGKQQSRVVINAINVEFGDSKSSENTPSEKNAAEEITF
jgi:single-strand DNA-binding protein